jgi:hypothetical protein
MQAAAELPIPEVESLRVDVRARRARAARSTKRRGKQSSGEICNATAEEEKNT